MNAPDAFQEGAICHEEYGSRDDNPYKRHTAEWFSWDIGYSNAKHGYYNSEEGWNYEVFGL